MNAESFIDTNIFVYQLERLDARKADIADGLIEHGIETQTACISSSRSASIRRFARLKYH